MPPKGPSVKQAIKKQEKIIEDKTFGLKNKNKSKAVQKYIASMQANMSHNHNPELKRKMAEQQKRKEAKAAKEQSEKELAKLFRDLGQDKKKDEEEPKVFDEATGEYLWQPEDFEAVEHDDRRLEEQLDEKLAEIKASRTECVRLTHEAFVKWLDKRAAAKTGKTKTAERKPGASGKKLWQDDAAVFVDDENAADEDEYVVLAEDEECAEVGSGAVDTSLFTGE